MSMEKQIDWQAEREDSIEGPPPEVRRWYRGTDGMVESEAGDWVLWEDIRTEEDLAVPAAPLRMKRNDLQRLVDELKAVVLNYAGRISVTEAIGALEIAKLELFHEQADA